MTIGVLVVINQVFHHIPTIGSPYTIHINSGFSTTNRVHLGTCGNHIPSYCTIIVIILKCLIAPWNGGLNLSQSLPISPISWNVDCIIFINPWNLHLHYKSEDSVESSIFDPFQPRPAAKAISSTECCNSWDWYRLHDKHQDVASLYTIGILIYCCLLYKCSSLLYIYMYIYIYVCVCVIQLYVCVCWNNHLALEIPSPERERSGVGWVLETNTTMRWVKYGQMAMGQMAMGQRCGVKPSYFLMVVWRGFEVSFWPTSTDNIYGAFLKWRSPRGLTIGFANLLDSAIFSYPLASESQTKINRRVTPMQCFVSWQSCLFGVAPRVKQVVSLLLRHAASPSLS